MIYSNFDVLILIFTIYSNLDDLILIMMIWSLLWWFKSNYDDFSLFDF